MTAAPAILVTGGAGYIGSHTCKALQQAGYHPVVYDNFSRGNRWSTKWGTIVEGDILNSKKLTSTLKHFNIELVIHLAAFSYVNESVNQPTLYNTNNITGTISLLDAMRTAHVKKLIFASSCAIYGHNKQFPLTEKHPQNPISPYGNTKQYIEKLLADFAFASEFKYTALRYFNVAGADLAGEIGEYHSQEFRIVPRAIQAAFGHGTHLVVYGAQEPTLDGSCIRDFIHVWDIAQGNVLAARALLANENINSHYNLCSGSGFSVFEIIEQIEQTVDRKIPMRLEKPRTCDPSIVLGSNSLFARRFGWAPVHSQLQKIISTSVDWQRRFYGESTYLYS